MNADADIQVWLETVARTQPTIIVPYLRSSEAVTMRYRLHTVRTSQDGRSELTQSGTVQARPREATPLSRLSVSRQANDECRIDLVLSSPKTQEKRYSFECPE